MRPRRAPKNASAAAAAPVEGRDHITNLPDGVLQHILSFLPSQDVVPTCVLAKRWRHMWKSTTVLWFCRGTNEPEFVEPEFVEHLLLQRISGDTPLDTCNFDLGEIDKVYMTRSILWVRIALQCKVRVLKLRVWCAAIHHAIIRPPDKHPMFISKYLKKLELYALDDYIMPSRFFDFSFCPILEDLKIEYGYLCCALLISSQSLKHLTIIGCRFGDDRRMAICAPNLVSLWLDFDDGRTPSLQRMPSLLTAFVKIDSYDDCLDDDYCNQSIVLQGLSEVQNLSLIAGDDAMVIFSRDLKFCSSFDKLKSLLLNEYWCEPADFSALACILKLSPVLEKLTLQLYSKGPKHKVEIKLSCKPLDMSAAISQHLKTLEIKCKVYDKRVQNVLTFLSKQLCFRFSGYKAIHENGPTII